MFTIFVPIAVPGVGSDTETLQRHVGDPVNVKGVDGVGAAVKTVRLLTLQRGWGVFRLALCHQVTGACTVVKSPLQNQLAVVVAKPEIHCLTVHAAFEVNLEPEM